MFAKNGQNSQQSAETMDTVIGAGTVVEGNVKTEASLRIEGKVLGEIHCDGDLVVGTGGIVEANIDGRNITVSGTVCGDVNASGTIHIEAKGQLKGNAKMKAFVIDEGGIFEGESKMVSDITVIEGKAKENKEKAK
ncbi:bactofilin family protein [Salirhabdus salicampi]|uniref:bactofilin family protein n=1 Tax=Salirhabdus salicampi TaxID=476102 RepID=UPI0020C3AF44|nr:polymer-forming cytoskeletal protein [Salirhabdus salicampi]MCP8617188.1 polymer-forming cytoskeletal protein [Salirhabdus salicampi]